MSETPTATAIADVRLFLTERWRERAAELGRPAPADLAGACKFAALFAQGLWGGQVRANFYHTWLETDDGVLDLTEGAGVTLFNPYERDLAFERRPEFRDSLAACAARVAAWLAEFRSPFDAAGIH